MGGYYQQSYDSSSKRRNSLLRILLRILFAVASIASAVALLLALFSPIMHPQGWWGFPILGLISPAIYIVNFAFALIWILRWRWWFAMPILILLIAGAGKVTRFAKIDINNHYETPSRRGAVKLMSFNLRSHINDDRGWSTVELAQYIDSISPDILCVQENRAERFNEAPSDKFKKYNVASSNSLSVYSRYPIVAKSENHPPVEYNAGASRSMWVDIKILNDTIRIFNNHLTSTMIKETDDKYLTSREFIADSAREDKLTDIISRFKRSCVSRAHHVDSLSKEIEASPYRVIVCGDFNDTPLSYSYRVMSHGLQDAFVECGTGYPYTYRGFMNTLRIDYILASEGVSFESYAIDTHVTFSDHLPVVTHFKLTK